VESTRVPGSEPDDAGLEALRADADQWRARQTEPVPFDQALRRVRRNGYARRALAGGVAVVVVAAVAASVWAHPGQSVPHTSADGQTLASPEADAVNPACASPTTDPAFAGMTWQLTGMDKDGLSWLVPNPYPINLAIDGDTYSAPVFATIGQGSVRVDGSSICFTEKSRAVAAMATPPNFSDDAVATMAQQADQFLQYLPSMTHYRISDDTLSLSDGSGLDMTFSGVNSAQLNTLQQLASSDFPPNAAASQVVDSVTAVKTTLGDFVAASPSHTSYTAYPVYEGEPVRTPTDPVWVIQWTGSFSIPHSCPTNSKSCVSKGSVYVSVVGAFHPTEPPWESILFDNSLGAGTTGQQFLLESLGVPIALTPF